MVNPIVITIGPELEGLTQIDIPQFAGYDIKVDRRGEGTMTDSEVRTLDTGGFELKLPGDQFTEGEVFTVTALPVRLSVAGGYEIPSFPVSQYPHRVSLSAKASSVLDDNGNWVSADAAQVDLVGRAEVASANAIIAGSDGQQIKAKWIVYLPLPIDFVRVGCDIEVWQEDTNKILTDTVKRFSKGQLNARIWV